MLAKNIVDSHVHTDNSPDARDSIMKLCEQAQQIGLKRFAVTDHCEVNYTGTKYDFMKLAMQSLMDARKAKMIFEGRIDILCGVELGQAAQNYDLAHKILNAYEFDFVIGSVHNAKGNPDFSALKCDDPSIDLYAQLETYYQEYFEISKWGKVDTIAHITYPLRYIEGIYNIPIDMTRYMDLIDGIYKNIIENGISLEINTSGLRQKYGKTFPSTDYLLRYRELGGELITIGSDAHCTEDLAGGIKKGYEIASGCGFKYVAYYKERKPVMVKIA